MYQREFNQVPSELAEPTHDAAHREPESTSQQTHYPALDGVEFPESGHTPLSPMSWLRKRTGERFSERRIMYVQVAMIDPHPIQPLERVDVRLTGSQLVIRQVDVDEGDSRVALEKFNKWLDVRDVVVRESDLETRSRLPSNESLLNSGQERCSS